MRNKFVIVCEQEHTSDVIGKLIDIGITPHPLFDRRAWIFSADAEIGAINSAILAGTTKPHFTLFEAKNRMYNAPGDTASSVKLAFP
ncbi:hypothetical protein C8E02_0990 [Vogesella indigofera]|uniref:Uncharacterized protein n=2 Tax=Vogesella indigofera TaxID=45465 RepID=A0A495BMH2_VOGIN|nr:hypothetical protein C8E02_0990 [Vogesella indigofera]